MYGNSKLKYDRSEMIFPSYNILYVYSGTFKGVHCVQFV